MIYSAIRKIEKRKQLVRKFGNFDPPKGMNICSVNLDCEIIFLALGTRDSSADQARGSADQWLIQG